MSGGYTKLWSSIIHSTVWREPMHVKVVWITMLAIADRDGLVLASLPGLADAARVTLDQAKEALAHLSAPDEYSRTKEHDGRRIEECDGGWLLLNHAKYRALGSAEERREQVKQAVRRHRSKAANVSDGNLCNLEKAQAETEAEAEAEAEAKEKAGKKRESLPPGGVVTGKPRAKNSSWSAEACDDWTARMASPAPGGKIGRSLKPLVDKHTWATVRPAWQRYLAETDAEFTSPSRFAETFGRWNGTAAAKTGNRGHQRPTTTEIYNRAAGMVERELAREAAEEAKRG